MELKHRTALSLDKAKRPTTDKIIFLSCEGQVTEEEYFATVSVLLEGIKSKVQFISVMGQVLALSECDRTDEQSRDLSKSQPYQLVEKIDKFKEENKEKFEFDKHPEDEFWIIADVDDHTEGGNLTHWNDMLVECQNKNYNYAISNPFFEIWLLLHHSDVIADDYGYAVTSSHKYQKTNHFKMRLRRSGAPLKDDKHIEPNDYSTDKIKNAIERAKFLDKDKEDWPHNLGSGVYKLLGNIVDMAYTLRD